MLLIVTGRVIQTHGLKGWVKVFPLSENPHRFSRGNAFIVEGKEERLTIEEVRKSRTSLLVKFAGIDDREGAMSLKGRELYVSEEEVGPPPPDSYWEHQLLGLGVYTMEGRYLGKVSEVFPTGSNDVLVVKGEREYLIPFIREVIREISLEKGRISIEPLSGLLED
jgi:16S rRNA processing protein RimM